MRFLIRSTLPWIVLVYGSVLPEDREPGPEALVAKLAHEKFEEREAAMYAIQELGAKAFDALWAAREHQDPEVRDRIKLLLPFAELLHKHQKRMAEYRDQVKTLEKTHLDQVELLKRCREERETWAKDSKALKVYGERIAIRLSHFGARELGSAANLRDIPEPELPDEPKLDEEHAKSLRYPDIREAGVRVGRPVTTEHWRSDSMPDAALLFLAKHQEREGRWDSRKYGSQHPADIAQTALALTAFLSCGHCETVGQWKDNVKRALRWLAGRQRESGTFFEEGSEDPVAPIVHVLASRALAEAAAMPKYVKSSTRESDQLAQTQRAAEKAQEFTLSLAGELLTEEKQLAGSSKLDLLTAQFMVLSWLPAEAAKDDKVKEVAALLKKWLDRLEYNETGFFS